MRPLVNFKKRGVGLPKGCKDLIDVLQPLRRRKVAPHDAEELWVAAGAKLESFPTHGLVQIERYVNSLLQSTSDASMVVIILHDRQTEVCGLFRMEGELHLTLFLDRRDAAQELIVRALFESLGIRLALDHVVSYPRIRLLRYPMPDDAPTVARIVTDVLVNAYRLREDAGLDFILDEYGAAA